MPKMQGDLLVQVTARLAMAAVWSDTAESCEKLSATALTLARDIQNPVTKAYALRARHGALWGPERFEERRQLISELGELSRASADAEIALMYRILNITAFLEQGDIPRVDREILEYTTLSNKLQLPHARWYVSLYLAMRALMEGRYESATTAANQFLELGNRVQDSNASQSFGGHLILRLWENNQLDSVVNLLVQFIAEHPTIPAWKCAISFFYSENDNTDGVRIFDSFAELGFDNIPLDETWAISIQMLTSACCNIENLARAEQLYELTLPGKMHHTIIGYGVMSWGSRARELGNLASLMGRFEEAQEHFELAITQNRKTGAAPWVARSQYDYAVMLARQRDPAYKDLIRELVAEAQQAADLLGMVRLKLQVADLIKEL
jgi:tetratricopeptide (TPR) repeat protein